MVGCPKILWTGSYFKKFAVC